MADVALLADPGERGRLTVRDRAVEHIAVTAALGTAGVVRHRRGLDKLTGRDLPRAEVVVAGNHARATVEVAVVWGQSLSAAGTDVREKVTEALTDLSGFVVDRVDVVVVAVAPQPDSRRLS